MKRTILSLLLFISFNFVCAQTDSAPIGTIVAWAGNRATLPSGWLVCDGEQISKDNYPQLCAILGNYWGPTDADPSVAHLFYLPDLRGVFLRGVNGSRNDSFADSDATNRTYKSSPSPQNFQSNEVGSYQADAIQSHQHVLPGSVINRSIPGGLYIDNRKTILLGTNNYQGGGGMVQPNQGGRGETRPKNVYVYYIIKAK